ncbi:putative gustatory receptor 28b [Anopheles arabiensis]|uniref:putative gustatory receptor 28b n=1 Tax=Anopheles arabiensis TaxID=7173 RepID=UPI001AAD667C|nr:putative gustatory receptor 28b [Anopheles arabiensis]
MSHDVAITKAVLVLIKCFGQLYGILPLSSNAFTFERSRPVLWYSRTIALLLMVIYPCAYIVLLTDHEFPILALSYYIIMLQFTLNYIIVGVLYLHVLFDPTSLLHVLNELIERTRALLRHIDPPAGESPVGRRLFFKTVAIDLLQSFTWYGTFLWLQRKFGATYILAFWLNSIAVMQIVAALNILLATLLWGAFLYRLINERVRTVIGSLLQLDDTDRQVRDSATGRERRFICNHIYLQLTILRTHHSALTKCIQNIVEFYNTPLALIMLYQFLIIISEIFYAYTSIVQDIKNDVDVPLGTYMSSILFAVFEAIQFYYIVSASSEITEEAEKTGVLLNEFLPTDPNPRVERCIESFAIELLHEDFKINNCGMYDVDYTLMFSMIATITSYLIMLVQFQLAEI